jgi:hypothetical protein
MKFRTYKKFRPDREQNRVLDHFDEVVAKSHHGRNECCNCRSYSALPCPVFTRHRRVTTSNVIAGMFMAIFERELGDTGFIELAQAFDDHAVVLLLGPAGER